MTTNSIRDDAGGTSCPACGSDVGAGVSGGLCPKCLLRGVAEAPTETAVSGAGERPGVPDRARLAALFPELEIHELVGAGGMGAVFKARQPHLDRWVALKVLPETMAAHAAFVERFHREARTLARLNHPNIVTVFDFGRRDAFCFLLMEFVDGVNLRQALRAGRFSPEQALGLVPKICEALQFAHDEGVLHRDIKPENLLLDGRGRVKIADFGIAKLVGDATGERGLTVSGAALGTPAYMAPEQIENPSDVDHRADIYSLGVVIYEMLTGELPLGRFSAPSEKAPLDRRVDEIVMRALAKERELRQQSATEVRTQVEGVTAGASAAAGSGTGANVAAPSPRSAGAEEADYVMCHPRLPRMAQWIVVYGLVVAPLLWLMSLGFLGAEKGSSPYAGFVRSIQNLVTLLGEGMVTAMWVRGAWKLRSLRVSGARTLVSAIWGHLCLGGLAVGLEVWLVNLRTVVEDPSAGEIGLGLAGLLALVFEIAALVWLNRNRHRLAMIGAEVRPSTEEVADELAATAPTTGVVRHATWSAVLTAASVVFGLAVIGGGALLGAAAYTNRGLQGAGLGPAEVAIALVGLLVVGGGGVVGAVLGWAGLREAKSRRERMAGFGRSLFGAMAWPLLFAQMAAMVGVGWILIRLEAASGTVLVTALAGTLVIGELGVRVVWRWIRSVPRGARAGRLPGTGRMLALGTALAAFVTLFPAYSVAWTGFLRSRIPPMVATVTSPEGSRSEGDLRVSYPPRSIVWWTASVYRDDVQIAEPRYTAHVVNGSLWEAAVHPVRVSGEADEGGHYGGWKLEVVSPTHSASFRAGGEGSPGVRWSRPAPGQEVSVAANETREIEVLAGTDSAGVRWAVRLKVRVEPLTPKFLFDGVLAGQGFDWETTAARAVALETKGAR